MHILNKGYTPIGLPGLSWRLSKQLIGTFYLIIGPLEVYRFSDAKFEQTFGRNKEQGATPLQVEPIPVTVADIFMYIILLLLALSLLSVIIIIMINIIIIIIITIIIILLSLLLLLLL